MIAMCNEERHRESKYKKKAVVVPNFTNSKGFGKENVKSEYSSNKCTANTGNTVKLVKYFVANYLGYHNTVKSSSIKLSSAFDDICQVKEYVSINAKYVGVKRYVEDEINNLRNGNRNLINGIKKFVGKYKVVVFESEYDMGVCSLEYFKEIKSKYKEEDDNDSSKFDQAFEMDYTPQGRVPVKTTKAFIDQVDESGKFRSVRYYSKKWSYMKRKKTINLLEHQAIAVTLHENVDILDAKDIVESSAGPMFARYVFDMQVYNIVVVKIRKENNYVEYHVNDDKTEEKNEIVMELVGGNKLAFLNSAAYKKVIKNEREETRKMLLSIMSIQLFQNYLKAISDEFGHQEVLFGKPSYLPKEAQTAYVIQIEKCLEDFYVQIKIGWEVASLKSKEVRESQDAKLDNSNF
uniref:Tudor domain-containing protein n=1 Tax=Strongyloides papillosus TaxID=174720 RepID=A0A0N5B2X8_STREA